MKVRILFFSLLIMAACSKNTEKAVPETNSNIFSTQVGDYKVHLLSEGQQEKNPEILIGATPEMIQKYAPTGTYASAINTFLIQTPDRNILIDTGLGKELTKNLQSLGLEESDITDILITHMHQDHVGGLLKDEDPRFPSAYLKVSIPEYDYIYESEPEESVTTIARMYPKFSIINPEIFSPNNEGGYKLAIKTNITAIPAYGHTPGHTAFLLESAGEKLLIWGDIVHAAAFQIPHPEVAITYDINPDDAIQSRKALLEYAAENNILVAGMHLPYPGMGYIKKSGDSGYKFIPL